MATWLATTSSISTAPALWPPDGADAPIGPSARRGARPRPRRFAVRSNRGEAGGPAEYSYEHLLAVARKRGA